MIIFKTRKYGQFSEVKVHVGNLGTDLGFLNHTELKELLEDITQIKEDLEGLVRLTDDS